MKLATLEAILDAFEHRRVRYLVVGGVAVNAHGYVRATLDLDLVVSLETDNALAAVEALAGLGYRPIVPESIERFADAVARREWFERRNMMVFSLVSDAHPETTVDLFINEPFDFDAEHDGAEVVDLGEGRTLRLLRLPALIEMKRAAGRGRDLDDVDHLQQIAELRREDRS